MKYILMNKNTKVLSANYQPSLGVFTDIYEIYNIDFAPVILKNVSNKEKDTILNYWDDLQDKHETQFEIDYMNSIQKDKGFIEEQEDEEEM